MGQGSRKMNFLIEKDVEQEMERLVPAGKRSKVVNEALRRQLELMRRKSAAEQSSFGVGSWPQAEHRGYRNRAFPRQRGPLMADYVIDASVILKWVLGDREEPDQGPAVELLKGWAEGRDGLWAPALWEYEVANFLGRELPDEAERKMEMLRRLEIRSVALTDGMIERCFQWMKTKQGDLLRRLLSGGSRRDRRSPCNGR